LGADGLNVGDGGGGRGIEESDAVGGLDVGDEGRVDGGDRGGAGGRGDGCSGGGYSGDFVDGLEEGEGADVVVWGGGGVDAGDVEPLASVGEEGVDGEG
jgi:hypothetical protein